MTMGKEETMRYETTKTQLPLTLELAEPMLIAGEVDIQLCGGSHCSQDCASFNILGVIDYTVDVQIDDNDF